MSTNTPRRLLIVSDAWHPQVNGVVRSLTRMVEHARENGFTAEVLGPAGLRTIALPGYSEIRLSCSRIRTIAKHIEASNPDYVHIATEGPLGWQARRWCMSENMGFTTSYHTQFPDYLAARLPVRPSWVYPVLRKFHASGRLCLVPTATIEKDLKQRGFDRLARWGRGVDAEQYKPVQSIFSKKDPPKFLYVGRLAIEKNIEAFLKLDLPGTKIVVGDGPSKQRLENKFPECQFLGKLEGNSLAAAYAAADVFVFPSKTDTFGIVILEALASGLPVAAFPVAGPIDVVGPEIVQNGVEGSSVAVLNNDLHSACMRALKLKRNDCRKFALAHSWQASAAQFFGHIQNSISAGNSHLAA